MSMTATGSPLGVVGSYASDDEAGLYSVRLDEATAAIERLDATSAGPNPSYVAAGGDGRTVYAVNETEPGTVTSIAVDPERGAFTRLDRTATGADGPCYCRLDATGRHLLVANYAGGAVSVVPVDADGSLGEPTDVVTHEGSGTDPERQAGPHPHAAVPGPDGRYVYVPDLGMDQVVVYELDHDAGTLTRVTVVDVPDGAGPRHLAFGPDGRRAYLVTELDSTVIAFERTAGGGLDPVSAVPTLPEGVDGENYPAAIDVHPSGEFLYASNRGHDSVATFALDDPDRPRPVAHESTRGEWPRDVALSPSGRVLLAANQTTDDLVAFVVDERDGTLEPTGGSARVPEPTCLRWV